jgi:hypothetical protein
VPQTLFERGYGLAGVYFPIQLLVALEPLGATWSHILQWGNEEAFMVTNQTVWLTISEQKRIKAAMVLLKNFRT